MTTITTSYCEYAKMSRSAEPLSLRSMAVFVRRAIAVRRQRQALGELPPELLADIGVTAQQVRLEAGRAFWDLPKRQ